MVRRFAPAAPDEETVYGAASPGWGGTGGSDPIGAWIRSMQDAGIERVLVLLTDDQLSRFDGLMDRYRDAFGHDRVRHAPIPDHHLAAPETLAADVLPFFRDAEEANEPVVAHCLAGIGRTGQALAAWLVAERGYEPAAAIETVRETGRVPDDAVRSGNAEPGELEALLRTVGGQ